MLKSHDELIEELVTLLSEQNYSRVVVANDRLYARQFLDYLAERDIAVAMVTPSQVDQFFRHAVRAFHKRYGRTPSARWHRQPRTAIGRLLRLAQGAWPPEPEIDLAMIPQQAIFRDYGVWMRDECGLAKPTIEARLREARRFLDWYFGRNGSGDFSAIDVQDIDLYMETRAIGLRRASIASSAAWLRSLLRFFHQSGRVSTDLSARVIGPMLYAYEGVPSILSRSQIGKVLEAVSKDRSPMGLRDHAILLLLATYGLRQSEICNLRLDDIDWRADALSIRHTKTNAGSRVPLLTSASDALLDYLHYGRPHVESREVFIRSIAPYTPMTSLYGVVKRRLADAGVTPAGKRGPHIFRHARAVQLLRASIPQKVVGDVLGHRSAQSVNAYLKLATEDLRAVALDVPAPEVLS